MPVSDINEFALTVAEQAKLVIIRDSETHILACEKLKDVVAMRKEVASTFGPMKEAAHKAHKAVIEQEKKVDGPLFEAELYLKRGIGAFQASEERKRREEESRLRRIAEEEARKKAEEIALQDALNAEQSGNQELAEAILAAPPVIAPVKVEPLAKTVTEQKGIAYRTNWKFRVTDESQIPRSYLTPDLKKIGEIVRAMREETKIPGIEVYPEETASVRLA